MNSISEKNESIKFGCQIISYGDVEKTIENSIKAEKSGFDAVTLPDHLFHPLTEKFLTKPPWEAFTLLGALATKTEKVNLLPGVADSVRRHPTLLAHSIATLDRLTDGRAVLGIGTGEAFNLAPVKDFDWEKPYTRFKETIEIIRKLWASTKEDPIDFKGEYFELEKAHLSFKPAKNRTPPIYVGGYGPKMRSLVGKQGDGWLPWIYTPDQYQKDLEIINESATKTGRKTEDIEKAVMLPTVVSSNSDEAWDAVVPRSRTCVALRPPLLRDMGYSQIADNSPNMWKMAFKPEQIEQLTEAAKKIPEELIRVIAIAGTSEEAIESIEKFQNAGVTHIVVFPVAEFDKTIKNYEENIIPYFKEDNSQ